MIKKSLRIRNLIIVFIWTLMVVSPCWSTPISEIKIEYDKDKRVLHIDAKHVVSSHIPQHRIRKIEIYKNETEIKTFHYPTQKPTGILQDLEIDLKPGDSIKVIGYCTEAGPTEETFIVPEGDMDSTMPKGEPLKKVFENLNVPVQGESDY